MRIQLFLLFILMWAPNVFAQRSQSVKTTIQTSTGWRPEIDVRSDAVMVYSVGDSIAEERGKATFEQRVQSWKERGYTIHFMTGIAWGDYRDYFSGAWDGKTHLDEGQTTVKQEIMWHGEGVPYIVPTANYLEYIKQAHVKRVIDAGIEHIFMEEPEFWAEAGYSEAFKREWKQYYGFDWKPQHESPENTYLANKLKYQLYYRALEEVFTFAKAYGAEKGLDVKCYVPTHSLINYSQWMIVSPEASLASLDCVDGYIAQVWTGTSRTPIYYDGKRKERVFETAFLEYGAMESMTAPTGRKMFFLTDPIEDDAGKDWMDYKKNYEATFVAQLLYPRIANYELMPWPERIYDRDYKMDADGEKTGKIPQLYATQMQVMINALGKMPISENQVSGSQGIGVLMANSLMFQRFPTHQDYEDPQLSNFFGQVLPLLKRGIPVHIVHQENLIHPETLKDTKVLIMSYANMKPLDESSHHSLAAWVKSGGRIVYCGRDDDPFQRVLEWWNSGASPCATASDHLFECLGMGYNPSEGVYTVEQGKVTVLRSNPKDFVLQNDGDVSFFAVLERMYQEIPGQGELIQKNSLCLERGVYDMIAVLDESVSDESFHVSGLLIDLFDANLPVVHEKVIAPGQQAFLLNINRVADKAQPQVLASASRIYGEECTKNSYSFTAKAPSGTLNVCRILLPSKPHVVVVDGNNTVDSARWDEESSTYLLHFLNNPDGVHVKLSW